MRTLLTIVMRIALGVISISFSVSHTCKRRHTVSTVITIFRSSIMKFIIMGRMIDEIMGSMMYESMGSMKQDD